MTRKKNEPITRFRPGLNMKLTSRTSLVARAIVSPTGWRLWKVMLLPSRDRYSSSRTSRSMRWAISSAPKLRPNCRMPRTICDPPRINASGMSTLVSGGDTSMALKACPTRAGTTAASAPLPIAPTRIMMIRPQCRCACETIQRIGPRRSETWRRARVNSAGRERLVMAGKKAFRGLRQAEKPVGFYHAPRNPKIG